MRLPLVAQPLARTEHGVWLLPYEDIAWQSLRFQVLLTERHYNEQEGAELLGIVENRTIWQSE